MKRLFQAAALLTAIAIVVVGCSPAPNEVGTAKPKIMAPPVKGGKPGPGAAGVD